MPFWEYGGGGIKRSEVGLDKNGVKTKTLTCQCNYKQNNSNE